MGYERLKALLGNEEEEEQTAVRTDRGVNRLNRLLETDGDEPANRSSREAYRELMATGSTTYGGKSYTRTEEAKKADRNTPEWQRAASAATAGASQDVARYYQDILSEVKATEPVEAKRELPGTAAQRYLATYDAENGNPALAGTLAAGMRAAGEELPVSTRELYRRQDLAQQTAKVTGQRRDQMAADMAANPGLIYDQGFMSSWRSADAWANTQQEAANRLTEEYNTTASLRREAKESELYGSLKQNPDFMQHAQGSAEVAAKADKSISPKMVRYYNIYNRREVRKEAAGSAPAEAYVTADEAAIYFYLWDTQGSDAAEAYYKNYVKDRAQERRTNKSLEAVQNMAQENPGAMSAASVPLQATGILGMIDLTIQNAARRVGINTDKPISYNTGLQLPSAQAEAIRGGVAGKIEDDVKKNLIEAGKSEKSAERWASIASFAYQTGMSMADSGVTALLTSVGVPEAATLTLMAGGAGMSSIREAKARGATDGQALAYGYAAAFAEYMSERVSLESLLKDRNLASVQGRKRILTAVLEILKQGFTEGSEEANTTLANTLTDMLINGDKSEISTRVQNLVASGVSETEARKAAAWDWLKGIALDAFGGVISGVGMGAPVVGLQLGSVNRNERQFERAISALDNAAQEQAFQEAMAEAENQAEAAETQTTPSVPAQTVPEETRKAVTPPPPPAPQRAPESATANAAQNSMEARVQEAASVPAIAAALEKVNRGEEITFDDARMIMEDPQALQALRDVGAEIDSTEQVQNSVRLLALIQDQLGIEQALGAVAGELEDEQVAPKPITLTTAESRTAEPGERIATATEGPRNDGKLRLMEESQTIGNPAENREEKLRLRGENTASVDEALRKVDPKMADAYAGGEDKSLADAVKAVYNEIEKGTISAEAGAEILEQFYSAGQDEAAKEIYLRSMLEAGTGKLRETVLKQARKIDEQRKGGLRLGGQTETAPAAEAAGEEGNDLDYGGRGRLSGQRAGEQNGRLGEARRAIDQPGKAIGRRNDTKALRVQPVNARDHIAEATGTITIVPDQVVEKDREMRAVARRLEAITGKKVFYIIGNIQRPGSTSGARGAITTDGIYLRCDHNDMTVTQIGAHELYHWYARENPGLNARLKEKIIQKFTAEEFNRVAQIYLQKLGRVNGITENMDAEAWERAVAKIEEEIFADAFGNMNAFGAGADRFTETARSEVSGTMGTENAAATEKRTGPPAQFSEDEQKMVDDDIPQSAAEYRQQRNRVTESSAEYARMRQRELLEEKELQRLENKAKTSAEARRAAAEAKKQAREQKELSKETRAEIKKLEAEIEKRRDEASLRKIFEEQGAEALTKEVGTIKRLERQLDKLSNPPEKKTPVKKSTASIAKKQLRSTLMSEFSIPAGSKAEVGQIIDAMADKILKDGKLTWQDQKALFDKLYSAGVMSVPADQMYQAAREIVRGGRIYVPEGVKADFGDDWAAFRREAFAEGIFLTNDSQDRGADSWNQELASEFPGLFPEDNYDQRDILERIVGAAKAGKEEQMSLEEYAATVVGQEYVSEDDLIDNMERQLDWALRNFADKAGLEIYLKDQTGVKVAEEREKAGKALDAQRAQQLARQAKEREQRKEAARRQARNRELREMQQRTLKQLQWLSRNRQKFSGNMQDRLNEILSDIDVYAISAADEAHLDKASNKTWRELADIYKDARENDPNFLPSKDLERIVARLDNRKIGDMDIDAVTDLYKAAVGLRTELYNRNNVIGSELHETFQEVYDQVKDEMQKAKGGYQPGAKGMAQKFFSDLQLTPMNLLERMAGWNKDSAWYKMAKQLEQGERAQRKFKTDSARMLAPFLEKHKEWVKKADGQGKDAIWYEVEVPELLELGMGDKPIFGNTVKVYMTPAQKVHMYLESQNYDNLRHMTGGRTFADKELYSKGKRAEAFAQGKTIRLAPETVKNLVKDLTPEEKALADALRPFYNEFSKKEINRVSNLLLGYNKAMEGDYAPIYTNQNYTKSEPGIFDTTAEGVGNLKSRVVSANPSLNISALDAFEKSVDRTSRYVGLAIPVRNMNTLMNWREKGNSMADVLTHKWGEDGKRFVNDLLTELQSGRETEQSSIEKLTNAALSRYISAVFGANPSIVLKQFASYPLAGAYLGWENMPLNVPRAARVDTDLIAKYTGEYDYRQLGYAMPETATLKDNPGKLQERGPLNFIFGGGAITWMDGFTVRTIWTWAENKVQREQPDLEIGTQEQIDAGQSPYYKAVAAEFEEAVSRSQPMYDTMHRANIMRESNPITRAFTLFKTVPMQEYNMLRQAIGEAQYAKENNLDKETQAAARQKAGRAFASILTGNLMIGAITILNALWKNRGKKYRDEDGELSAEKLIAEAGKQYFKDAAGLVIGGGEAADILSSILFGDKWYGLETPGMEQIGSILDQTVKAGQTVQGLVKDSIEVLANGGNWAQYMADHSEKYISAVDSVARTLGTYATGLPIDNVKAYLLGAVQWLSPEVKTAYEDIMDKADRSGLKGLSGASLEIRTKHILQERAGSADEETAETLAGLYAAGYKDAIPAAQQTKVSIDGEERQLNLAQQQTYKKAWQETVGGSLNELVSSKEFQEADEKTQAKMLKKLYDLATDRAKGVLFDDVEDDTWEKAQDMLDAGIKLEDYVSAYARFNAIKNDEELSSYERGKQQREMISGMDYSDEAKLALYESMNPSATSRIEKFREIMDAGLSFSDVMKVYDKYAAIDERGDLKAGEKAKDFALWVDTQKYSTNQKAAIKDQLKYGTYMSMDTERYDKLTGKGLDPTTAYNVDQAISSLTPEAGKESVSDTQKWEAAMKNTSGEANQKKALEALMTEAQYAKYQTASDAGISASVYVQYKVGTKDLTSDKDANGKTISGSLKQKVVDYIDSLDLTKEQKSVLLTDYNKDYKNDVSWHNGSYGGKGSGGGRGTGSYAPARIPTLRIPAAPKVEKPKSGLRITARPQQEAARPSGLRITARAK